MRVNAGTIIGMILSLVFILVLFNMLPTILPSVITSINNLFNSSNLGSADIVGAGASAFASNVTSYLGWFWIIGPFVLVIGVILALFLGRHR